VRPLAIEVDGLTKTFGKDTPALRGVTFSVPAGTTCGMLGPNGAGKTTTINILSTLLRPSSGHAAVAGYDIARQGAQVRASIGVAGQFAAMDPLLTGRENLVLFGRLRGLRRQAAKARADELIEQFDLVAAADRRVSTYSGGMRRRLDLASALTVLPKVLFLDEPTTGLDPASRISVWEMITNLRAQQGRTLFLTTHYMDEADRLCDRVAIVDRGRIVALDTPVALKASVPGASRIELQFEPDLPNGAADLERLPAVKSVLSLGSAAYRISSDRGPASAQELLDLARQHHLELKGLSVQSTSLDDVFLHYTGHGLAEIAEPAVPAGRGKGGHR